MNKTNKLAGLIALCAIAGCALPAQAAEVSNGFRLNGTRFNGFQLNGARFNGFQLNGTRFNGFRLNGTRFNGFQLNGFRLDEIDHTAPDIDVAKQDPKAVEESYADAWSALDADEVVVSFPQRD